MINQQLRNARQSRGHSMESAAREVGVTYCTWLRWEHGISKPTSMNVKRALQEYLMLADSLRKLPQ